MSFVRHGETDSTGVNRVLSAAGRRRISALTERYTPCRPLLIVSSILERAMQSAFILSQAYQVDPIMDSRLNEPRSAVAGIPPRLDLETWERYIKGFHEVLVEVLSSSAAEVMIVAHSGTVDAMFDLLGTKGTVEVAMDHGAVTEFKYRPGDPEGEWLFLKHNWHPEMTRP
ncbi:MAG: phosphoglycerate mutase family protein [Propionibacteriaceae bacterium]|nr:phosphoglycerate mutase family protein [Propionibacteriaceae bacterium]